MALTVTENSVRQINAALLSLEKKIGETNNEKAQDKQTVQMELKNVQYNFRAPLRQDGISVGLDTTGVWEGTARTATSAENALTAENATNDSKGNNISTTYATKNDIGNKVNYGFTSMVGLGFTQGSYVSVRDFWTKIYAKYSKGNGVIKLQWADSKAANLGTSTNYVTINGGTLIYTCGSPNKTWSDFSAIYITGGGGDHNNVYHIRAHISDNTTVGAERWNIYTLANKKYINDKLNSPLPWGYNYLTSGYSSSLQYRKIGRGYFNYPTGNWSFYSEIEMLYHRPNFFERGTIYITMRGQGSDIAVMNVRYQYKNGTSSIQLLSNTKVNYKVDTTNKRIYLELLAYCNSVYTMILFRNSLTRTGDMLLTENNFWTFAPTASYVQSSDTMQAGVTDGYTEIPMTATGVNITKTEDPNNGDTLQIGDGNKVVITNAKHAAAAYEASTAGTARSADITRTLDAFDGDELQIGDGTKVHIVNSVHARRTDSANITKTEDTVNGDKLQIGDGTAVNITNAKHAATSNKATKDGKGNNIVDTYATKTELVKANIPLYDSRNAIQTLMVNRDGTGLLWATRPIVSFTDYKTESFTFGATTEQKKIELSKFGPNVTERNVLNFMVIYWNGVPIVASGDWAKSHNTGSSGLACALHALKPGTGWCVVRCVYLV